MAVSSELIKQLREKTSAGFMACKKALDESNGDLVAAEEYLRKKGLMDAAKKSSRTAGDGLISCMVTDDLKRASIVEINSETDFVAKNDKFQGFVKEVTEIALDTDSDNILNAKFKTSDRSVNEELSFIISVIGENIQYKRSKRFEVKNGIIGTYTHNAVAPGAKMGKIGVLVCLESEDTNYNLDEAREFGKKLAMHIAASNPKFLSIETVSNEVLSKEKEIAKEQAMSSGKPEAIAEKIAEGRIKKFYEEVVLLDQLYFEDNKSTVSDVLNKFNKEHKTKFKIIDFARYQLGE
ncbi:MAG: translation elongation factor Ts [Alphaproteobacteria bacterium]|nr:translation elongation factor Ts [Alphaproteobacteria bacterium]